MAGDLIDLVEFLAGALEADLQSVDFAEPSLAAGFGDAREQVVADLGEAVPFGRVRSQERAAQTGLTEMILVNFSPPRRVRGVTVLTEGDREESWFAALAGVSPKMAAAQSWKVR